MAEWSDGRIDEFAVRMDERFDRVDEKIGEVDRRIGEVARGVDRKLGEVDRRFDKLDHESARVNDRLDDLIKVVIVGFIGITGGIIAGFAAIVALIATQL